MKRIKKFLSNITLLITIVVVITTVFGNENKLKKFGRLTVNEIKYQIGIRQYPEWIVQFATLTEERWTR